MKNQNIDNIDILFVSNFSYTLNEVENNVAKFLDKDMNYMILTYRKTDMKNSYSYEEFIDKNFDFIVKYPISEIQNEFKDTNLYLSLVSERFISNYYYGVENTLGNKELSYNDILFLIKSFVLFLTPYMKKSNLIFTGYADNFISTLTYYLSEHYNKKSIAFHEIMVIDNNSNFLIEGLYAKPYKELIIKNETKTYEKLIEFINNYDGSKDRKERAKKNKMMKKGLFGVFSPNIFDLEYLKFAFFGYKVKNKNIVKYMNIDKPNIFNKFFANISRIYNKLIVSKYIKAKRFNFKEEKDIKYIYFPLQIQPEASTSSRAPFYMNQLATIENISKSLPLGYKLIVKEHPLAIGMNSINFYKKINTIPNVLFINNNISGKEIIKISDLIISFGGTTLFESLLNGKKILILLKDYYYSESKLIFKVSNKNDIYSDIINALNSNFSQEEIEIEKEKMLNFFYQRGFPRFQDFEKNIADNLVKIYNMNSFVK